MRGRRWTGVGVVALAMMLVAAACSDGGGGSSSDTTRRGAKGSGSTRSTTRRTTKPAQRATFQAHGGVGQIWVEGARPGAKLAALDAGGKVRGRATVDKQGTVVFRTLPAGPQYRVREGAGETARESAALTVTTPDQAPPRSFYAKQRLRANGGKPGTAGYGYLRTRDGTLLSYTVRLPGPPDKGPYPTVVEYSGYSPSDPKSPQPSTLLLGVLGYATVGINIRGSGCSGGSFLFFEPPQSTDGYDAVETVAAQPWVAHGKVGMVGISYPGISQLFTAQLRPPHLAAIAPLSVIDDTFKGTLYPGGIFNNGFTLDFAKEREADARPGGQPWAAARIKQGDKVCARNQAPRGWTPQIVKLLSTSNYYPVDPLPGVADRNFGDTLAPATFVDRIDVPTFLAGAWDDEQTGPHWATMIPRFAKNPHVWFTGVNGTHTESLSPDVIVRWFEFIELFVAKRVPNLKTLQAISTTIYKTILGVDGVHVRHDRFAGQHDYAKALATFERDPRVRILFEEGAGSRPGLPFPTFEAGFDRWPPKQTKATTWYLQPRGRLTSTKPTVSDGAKGSADSWVWDPKARPRRTFEGSTEAVWAPLPRYHWLPLAAGKAAAYETDPLAADTVMVGSGSVDLSLASNQSDTDLQVTISEVRPDGQEMYVQSGWLRASQRKLDTKESTELRPVQTHLKADIEPLRPGRFTPVRVEVFPFAHAFHKGSRLRVSVEAPGDDRPHWAFATLPAKGTVVNRIAHSAGRISKVVLPVVPGVKVPTKLPPCPSLRGQPCRAHVPLTNTPAAD